MTDLSIAKNEEIDAKLSTTPIALIGMASIFPEAKTLPEYWDNILRKIDCISDVPPSRWKIADYYDPDPTVPDKTYCKRGGFIPDIDFDPMEFGLPPNILEVTDVSQLLGLVVARDALEDAGYGEGRQFDRERVGVTLGFVGMGSKLFHPLVSRLQYPIWERVLRSSGVPEADIQRLVEKAKTAYAGWEENSFPGTIGNVVAGRIANRFDLGGINCVVDAACASSLAAIRFAIAELVEGRADMMLTGGVDTDNSVVGYMCFSKTPAFTKHENVRTFDAESDGMMMGEGIGIVMLKRLADAERDGDRIYAVIKSIASSSDGRFKSIYAPRPTGQLRALRRAYAEAGFPPETLGLVEAHGTGTMAGDPAEFESMKMLFEGVSFDKQTIALGSVKSQIAHTKSVAGTASLIKVALALHHKILPATLNVTRPNPKFGIEQTPFYINTETRPWIRSNPDIPRRASVSSFGFGGTNFHAVLEEYQAEHEKPYRLQATTQSFLLSAPTPASLAAACAETLQRLQGAGANAALNELAQAARENTPAVEHARVGFVADGVDEVRAMLQIAVDALREKPADETWEHPKGVYYRKAGMDTAGRVVALFPGQGSQYVDMGRELANNFPPIRTSFSAMDGLFLRDGLHPLSRAVYPHPVFDSSERDLQVENLQRTEHAQPAIGVFSAGLYKLLQQAGFQADFTAGHSFGELTALWASGAFSEEDFFTLAKARGKAMAPPDDPNFDAGTMIAVKGDVEKIRELVGAFPAVKLANWNSNNQVVLAGAKADITAVHQHLTSQGFSAVALPVSAAFHTPLVGHAQKPFAAAIQSAQFHTPTIPVFSNSTGKQHSDRPEDIQANLAGHILNPVLFKDEIEAIYASGGRIFVEIGPKNVLSNLVDNILEGKPHLTVAVNASAKKDSDRQLREAITRLRVAGLSLPNFDPYGLPRKGRKEVRSAVAVKLNGGLTLGDRREKLFEAALNDGWKVSFAQPAVQAAAQVSATAPAAVVRVPAPAQPARQQPAPVQTVRVETAPPAAAVSHVELAALDQAIQQFQAHQTEIARLHAHYLDNEAEYGRIFSELTRMEGSLLSSASTPEQLGQMSAILENLERSMTRFHDHQAETLRVHEAYLKTQSETTQSYIDLLQQGFEGRPAVVPAAAPRPTAAPVQPAPAPTMRPVSAPAPSLPVSRPAAAPLTPPAVPTAITAPAVPAPAVPAPAVPAPAAPAPLKPAVSTAPAAAQGVDAGQITKVFLEVVSEKTGYPVEMLELDMDMEADLGIDSIKCVEILGAVRSTYPDLPKVEPEIFAELRSLAQVVNHVAQNLGASAKHTQAPVQTSAAGQTAAAETPAAQGVIANQITQVFLEVVSEKTGYPVEMLELDMDMEADLGIDSIKRVEILGAVRSHYPNLPKVEPEVFAELRSLAQVVNHVAQSLGAGNQPTLADALADALAEMPAAAAVPHAVDGSEIAQALLEVVSEKTGYPVEMLDPTMDMEADLGIDSIKRVEILGAVRSRYPDLPKVEPEVFAELRTLAQVTAHIQNSLPAAAPAPESVPAAAPAASALPISAPVTAPVPANTPAAAAESDHSAAAEINQNFLAIVSEKTGYPVEMLELSMDMEADLGIDSIKRVEILGAMRSQYTALPKVEPEVFAELRTLGQVVAHIQSSLPALAPSAPAASQEGAAPSPFSRLTRGVIHQKHLPTPDQMHFNMPAAHIALLTDDGTQTTSLLAQELQERQFSPVVLRFPASVVAVPAALPAGIPVVSLADLSEENLQNTLHDILTRFGPPALFIHLDPPSAADPALGLAFSEMERAVVKHVFLMAKHLKAPLATASTLGQSAFLAVIHLDGEFGLSASADYEPISGGISGLVKTLNLEWDAVYCRCIDLHPAFSPEETARKILAEIHDPNRLVTEVGYGPLGRSTLVVAPMAG